MIIKRITLLRSGFGADCLLLHTALPPTGWPKEASPKLTLLCAVGTGADYCEANFPGIEVVVVGVTQ